jgi:competence protein ComFC
VVKLTQMKSIKTLLLDFLFPTACLFCNKGTKTVCTDCFDNISIKPFERDGIYSLYEYKDKRVNKLLWRLKYHHTHDIASVFGPALGTILRNILDKEKNIYLIPIPLSPDDKRFANHAKLIADSIKENVGSSLKVSVLDGLLIKQAHTKQAHTKDRKERLANTKNIFSVNEKTKINTEGDVFVLVDDVFTTGSTLKEARAQLSKHLNIPESEIFSLVVAH